MGMTGVTLPPGSSAQDMANGLRVARNYMRDDGIVGLFIEDIEKMADKDRALALDNLDGAVSKSDRILIMMTTNFPEQIASAFLRQGRVDDYIEVGLPDLEAFTRLINLRLKEKVAPDIDWERAFAAYEDYTPAWIVGGMSKVIRSVIARTHSAENITVTTDDLVTGATLMRRQWELQDTSAKRAPAVPTLEQAFIETFKKAAEDGMTIEIANAVDRDDVAEVTSMVVDHKLDGAQIKLKTEMGKPIEGQLGTN
jgi:SpoVK/Ycf46/Vps4 family AAA+-type ATPase